MGIEYSDLIELIDVIAPQFLMEEWDNSGIQIKTSNSDIEKIMVVLEIRDDVIQEAILNKVDLIITHHPLIFHEINQINTDDTVGRYINKLIMNNISVFSTHTTFDKAIGGNNDYLIGLINLKMSRIVGTGNFGEFGIGRLTKLKTPISLDSMISTVEEGLAVPASDIKKVGDAGKLIQKIGICSGSGASLINDALKNSCDLLITGDVKYHDAQYAKEMGLCLIDAGHYYTERIFSVNFAKKLNKLTRDKVTIIESKINLNPFGN